MRQRSEAGLQSRGAQQVPGQTHTGSPPLETPFSQGKGLFQKNCKPSTPKHSSQLVSATHSLVGIRVRAWDGTRAADPGGKSTGGARLGQTPDSGLPPSAV